MARWVAALAPVAAQPGVSRRCESERCECEMRGVGRVVWLVIAALHYALAGVLVNLSVCIGRCEWAGGSCAQTNKSVERRSDSPPPPHLPFTPSILRRGPASTSPHRRLRSDASAPRRPRVEKGRHPCGGVTLVGGMLVGGVTFVRKSVGAFIHSAYSQ